MNKQELIDQYSIQLQRLYTNCEDPSFAKAHEQACLDFLGESLPVGEFYSDLKYLEVPKEGEIAIVRYGQPTERHHFITGVGTSEADIETCMADYLDYKADIPEVHWLVFERVGQYNRYQGPVIPQGRVYLIRPRRVKKPKKVTALTAYQIRILCPAVPPVI
jgi:hypothetical protein